MAKGAAIDFYLSRSMDQELTFHTLETEMQKRSIEIGPSQMRTLKLIGDDGLYTNLALLLSDQCETTTKVALFQGTDKELFRDRKEFTGSVLKQLEEVYAFIDLLNKTKATFSGLNRTDTRDYPEEAVREALLNSIVHRDYSFSGSNLINIYDDRIEFVSLGGLVSGLELKSIFLGVSQSRNPDLAAVFYRMRLIESYGTGIGKIERSYKMCRSKPEFETAKGVFRVTLPNRNEEHKEEHKIPMQSKEDGNNDVSLSEQKDLLKIFYGNEKRYCPEKREVPFFVSLLFLISAIQECNDLRARARLIRSEQAIADAVRNVIFYCPGYSVCVIAVCGNIDEFGSVVCLFAESAEQERYDLCARACIVRTESAIARTDSNAVFYRPCNSLCIIAVC